MRILNTPVIMSRAAAEETRASAPAIEPERIVSLENIAKTLLQKITHLDERIRALESAPRTQIHLTPPPTPPPPGAAKVVNFPVIEPTPEPSAVPVAAVVEAPVVTPVTLDADAIKKGLLTKMWKYMNDDQSRKTI